MRLPTLLLALLAFAASPVTAAVDYLRDVKPILTQHCVRCHCAQKEEAGLRLDTAAALRLGGESGSVVRRTSSRESLLLTVITGTHDDIPAMPYKKPPLSPQEIEILRTWVGQGAPAPDIEEPGVFQHWAFVAPQSPPLPAVKNHSWPRNPIDRFILARLEAGSIAPSPEADPVTLLRRLSLDLTGLPPHPSEIDAFRADRSPGAYERAVDRLLASPHYGERWARPWLDVARYADSNGYSIDAPRQIWKYRDWVVSALNRDLPFDQFVVEQLAGDLLPNPTTDQRVATGFNRNTQINQEGGIDPEQFRIESVLDRVNTFGAAFLGLTLSCAQCHDHKFDPITQRDYYRLYAFFNNTVDDGHGKSTPGGTLAFPSEIPSDDARLLEIEEARADLERFLDIHGQTVVAWSSSLDGNARGKLPSATAREAIGQPWANLSLRQKRALYSVFPDALPEFRQQNDRLTRFERNEPKPVTTLVMSELPKPRESVIFIKGDFTRPGDAVTPGTPAALPTLRTGSTTPNRLDLARWVVDPSNPLTARVFMNRVWQQYFGRGLVETENDFGTQGIHPSHPGLLDWLATEFRARQWSVKAMHRLIVTSATYRQSSRTRPDLEISDPLNHLLSRQPRLRLDAEIVRDVALAASGLLVPRIGGPPVFPPQPEGVMSLGQVKRDWKPSTGEDRHRRGLYTHFWRATPHPALTVFDAADGFSACTRRLRSNTPLQALTLLNDRQFFEFATALANRIQRESSGSLGERLDFAFRLCLARAPSPGERQRLTDLFQQQLASATGDATSRETAAWIMVSRVLLNLDETITRE